MPRGNQVVLDIFTAEDLASLANAARGFGTLEAYTTSWARTANEEAFRWRVGYASAGFFQLLGMTPSLGRLPSSDESRLGVPQNVVVLSDRLWRQRFRSERSVIGKSIQLDSSLFTVIGVARPEFEGVDVERVDAWVPLASFPNAGAEPRWWEGSSLVPHLLLRLDANVSEGSLEARLTSAYRDAHRHDSMVDADASVIVAPLLAARGPQTVGDHGTHSRALAIRLMFLAILVLFLAVLSVSGILVMRTLGRRAEFSVRLALGMSTARLLRQLLAEGFVLGFVSCIVALATTAWSGAMIRTSVLNGVHLAAATVDGREVLLAAGLGFGAALSATLAPIAFALRTNLACALRSSGSSSAKYDSYFRKTLLAAQSSLCLVILVCAGLLLRSLQKAVAIDHGFDQRNLTTVMWFHAPREALEEAVRRIAALPDVVSVSRLSGDLAGASLGTFHTADATIPDGVPLPLVDWVDTSFFRTAGLRMIAGRALDDRDVLGAEQSAVISEGLARQFFGNATPLGSCFYSQASSCHRIVGVVADIRWNINEPARPRYFLPIGQESGMLPAELLVRTKVAASQAVVAAIRTILSPLGGDPLTPPHVSRVVDRLEPFTRPLTVAARLFLMYGVLALLVAAIGVYGLVNYDVTQKAHDLAVCAALGATPNRIVFSVVISGIKVVVVGIAIGLCLARLAGSFIAAFLFETEPDNAAVMLGMSLLLVGVAALASIVPALKASRLDPAEALRTQ